MEAANFPLSATVPRPVGARGPHAGVGRWPLLSSIARPADLIHFSLAQLTTLAQEIRQFLIASVTATGGHLGPNLGVVELSIALHRVFDSPRDTLLFDTGHQSYVHKILTGRCGGFERLRRAGGLSGYPSRTESDHDVIENSHASTSLSWSDGIARAHALAGIPDRHVVAIVGDGALTGGMCWEALNNIGGAPERPVIIVLNDNGRSYAPTVGGIAAHLTSLRTGWPRNTGQSVPTIFGALGLAYIGPVDGHDIAATERALRRAAALRHPVVVHCVTIKGKGYGPAEADAADCLHAVGILDAESGLPATPPVATWTDAFATELLRLGTQRREIIALTAAMAGPTGLQPFADAFPQRCIDVGISEQHAMTCAAGLAHGGLHPVVAIYATFLGRAVDQILMDIALHRLPVTIVADRAGITGPDGPSHHGMFDTAILSTVPGLLVAAPRDPATLRDLLAEAVAVTDCPTMLRFPKAAAGPDIPAMARMDGIDYLHRSASLPLDVLLVAAGVMAGPCLVAATSLQRQGIGVTVVDPRWILPANPALPHLVARHHIAFTVEDCVRTGGMGTALTQACIDADVTSPVHNLGLPQAFLPQGTRTDLLVAHGLDANGITRTVLDAFTGLRDSPHRTAPLTSAEGSS